MSRYRKLRDAGLCVRCMVPAGNGKSACDKCLAKDVAKYQERKANGLCVTCGAGLEEGAESGRCVECEDRHRRSQIKYRASDGGKKANREKMARRRARAALAGTCQQCSAPATNGRLCHGHARAHVARCKEYLARKRAKTSGGGAQ